MATSGEQAAQVGEAELRRRGVAGLEDVGEQGALGVLQGDDLLLDGAGADQLVAGDDLGLADAVRAVGGLRLGGGVPPWVEVDDDVGAREVEAGAAGLE